MGGLVQYTVDFGDTPKSEAQRICEMLETISWNGVFPNLERPIVRFYLEQGQEPHYVPAGMSCAGSREKVTFSASGS